MVETMTPSEKPITKGQAAKLYDVLVDALVKSGLPSGPVQQVLQTRGAALADDFVAAVRRAVEAISTVIVRRVHVDRSRSPQQMLDATGRTQYTDAKVVAVIPRGEGGETEVFFFKPRPEAYKDGLMSDDRLADEFKFHNLEPDPYAQAAVNQADPALADKYPNRTHFKDADGNWCFATFDRWSGGRKVDVYRSDDGCGGRWWLAGVRK